MILISLQKKEENQIFKNELMNLQRELESPTNIFAKSKEIKWRIRMQDNKSIKEEGIKSDQNELLNQVLDIIDDQKKEILKMKNSISKVEFEFESFKNHLLNDHNTFNF